MRRAKDEWFMAVYISATWAYIGSIDDEEGRQCITTVDQQERSKVLNVRAD